MRKKRKANQLRRSEQRHSSGDGEGRRVSLRLRGIAAEAAAKPVKEEDKDDDLEADETIDYSVLPEVSLLIHWSDYLVI